MYISKVLFIQCKMSSVLSFLTVARTSSTYLFQVLMSGLCVTDLFSRSCMIASARKLERGDPHRCTLNLSVVRVLEREFSREGKTE